MSTVNGGVIGQTRILYAGFLGVFDDALIYIVACLLLIYFRRKHPEKKHPYKVPQFPITPILGILLYLLAIIFLGICIIIVGVVWCLIGIISYYLFGRPLRKKYSQENSLVFSSKFI